MTEKQHNQEHDHDQPAQKAFVKPDGQTTLVCPKCSTIKIVSVTQFKERQHRLKVRCSCSHTFMVNLDFRRCYRKDIDLEGTFMLYPPAAGGGSVHIRNLSQSGICFEAPKFHSIMIGQKGRIDFTLDNKKKSRLVREFAVRSIHGSMIGCEFLNYQEFEKELGFYLRFDS